ncbi:MAG TPA: alpha-E domain-containing protein [Chthoniobacteraceae bacterium]|jgi:uncharacterized alpha-E superfamily protein|nr:alpha-E domain-containing protein [Chthoniobacteraceae bacterium]
MLSRVANSLYWLSRYIERADNVARILDVNLQLLLDFRRLDDEHLSRHWLPIVQTTGDEDHFFELYEEANGRTVTEYFVFQRENPNSIACSIAQARENARMVRDQITIEMWEEINRIHLLLRSDRAQEMWASSPTEFFHEVRASSCDLQGLIASTIPRNEGWYFLQAGKYIERADKTTRILDLRHASLPSHGVPGTMSQTDALEWSAILRSCSAWDAYRHIHGVDVGPRRVSQLLLLSPEFPRSVRFCVAELDSVLRALSGAPPGRFWNDAEKRSGRLLSQLQFTDIGEIFARGLHEYLDSLQLQLNDVGEALFSIYIYHPFHEGFSDQQQQQQQVLG